MTISKAVYPPPNRGNSIMRSILKVGGLDKRYVFKRACWNLLDLMARHAADVAPFKGDVLWSVLMLELWHRRHADAGGQAWAARARWIRAG